MRFFLLLFFVRLLTSVNRIIRHVCRKSLCSAAVLALLVLLQAQASEAGWPVSGGAASANTRGAATATDTSGNVYLTGFFQGATCTFGGVTLTRIGTQDAFVVKLDASGTIVWAKNFGGSGASMFGKGIAVDGDGNVYLGGYFTNASLTTPALTKIGSPDAFALKLDATGATTWAKNFGGTTAATYGWGIAVDGSGNVYLGGSFAYGNLTNPVVAKRGGQDAFAIKLDSTGTTTWVKNFGGASAYASGQGIAVDSSGNVYLGGYFYNASLTTPPLTKFGGNDAFALKLDATGTTTWAGNYGGTGADAIGQCIAVDGDGNVYLGGYFYTASLTTPAVTKIGSQDAFALKLGSTGTTTWAKNFGGSGASAYNQGIAVDGSGNVHLGGYFTGNSLTTPAVTRIGAEDAFAFKLDATGVTTWTNHFGGYLAYASGQGIAVDGSGNVYLGGYFTTASLTTPAVTKIGTNDALALKLDSTGSLPSAAPTITGITPTSGPTAGGTAVTITGTGFVTGATVTIGGTAATSVTRNSATSISATTPAGSAGAQNVIHR